MHNRVADFVAYDEEHGLMVEERFNTFVSDFVDEYAREYAVLRPSYPDKLFRWLAEESPSLRASWDVGTGTGQGAIGLARHFDVVHASDTNEKFLAHAVQHERIAYNGWPAERPELLDASVDLVTSGMAAQWFDLDQFYNHVRRVLRPDGLLTIFGFFFFEVSPVIDQGVKEWYFGPVQDYVPHEIKILQDGYRDLPFPFERLDTPEFELRATWTAEDMIAFIAQWGLVKAAVKDGFDAMAMLAPLLRTHWGEGRRQVHWPLTLLAARP